METTSDHCDYVPLCRIGVGGIGAVYLYRKEGQNQFFAGKLVCKNGANEEMYCREVRGLDEFMPLSTQCEGLVTIYKKQLEANGDLIYIMELADDESGGRLVDVAQISDTEFIHSLQDSSFENGTELLAIREKPTFQPKTLALLIEIAPLPARTIVEILDSICDGLEFLHSKRVVHRDIKPSNIVFVNRRAKIADPGLVTKPEETVTNARAGTEGYNSLDSITSPAADIFSLGKVLYQLCTGNPVSQFPLIPASLSQHPDHQQLLHFLKVAENATHPNARHRYQSIKSLRRALLAWNTDSFLNPFLLFWMRAPTHDRRKVTTMVVACLALICAVSVVAHGYLKPAVNSTPIIQSHFDDERDELDGWKAIHHPGGQQVALSWVASSEDSHAGHIRAEQIQGDNNTMFFQAPPKFCGDQSIAYKGHLHYRIRQIHMDQLIAGDEVRLESDDLRLGYRSRRLAAKAWEDRDVPLEAGPGWTIVGNRRQATQAEFQKVLKDLKRVLIRAEFSTRPKERTDLDEVRIVTWPRSPRLITAAEGSSVDASRESSATPDRLDSDRLAKSIPPQTATPEPVSLTEGRSLCFLNNRWNSGLPYLAAQTREAGIQMAALHELKGVTNRTARIEAGNKWADAGQKLLGSDRWHCFRRARYWWNQALQSTSAESLIDPALRSKLLERIRALPSPEAFLRIQGTTFYREELVITRHHIEWRTKHGRGPYKICDSTGQNCLDSFEFQYGQGGEKAFSTQEIRSLVPEGIDFTTVQLVVNRMGGKTGGAGKVMIDTARCDDEGVLVQMLEWDYRNNKPSSYQGSFEFDFTLRFGSPK